MSSQFSHLAPLRDVFRALAQEADALGALGAGLEQAISVATYADGSADALQNIDRLMHMAGRCGNSAWRCPTRSKRKP